MPMLHFEQEYRGRGRATRGTYRGRGGGGGFRRTQSDRDQLPNDGIDGNSYDARWMNYRRPPDSPTDEDQKSDTVGSTCSDEIGLKTSDSGVFSGPASLNTSMDSLTGVMVARKKAAATRDRKPTVPLLANIFPLNIGPKVVYRYDVSVTVHFEHENKVTMRKDLSKAPRREMDLTRKGPRDDAAITERHKFCLAALKVALEKFRVMREGEAYVFDGASILFSSQHLDEILFKVDNVIELGIGDLSPATAKFIEDDRASMISIEIMPCRNSASSFNTADFQAAQSNRDLSTLDRTWKQFFNMLTNQFAIDNGRFTLFGAGKLFAKDGQREDFSNGQELIHGADKGIKFIEGVSPDPSSVVAALILDSKTGQFFKEQSLVKSVEEILEGSRGGRGGGARGGRGGMRGGFHHRGGRMGSRTDYAVQSFNGPFPFYSSGHRDGDLSPQWHTVDRVIRNLRLTHVSEHGGKTKSFIAGGITSQPISMLMESDPSGRSMPLSQSARFAKVNIRQDWPAVVFYSGRNKLYYPMELLKVAPNQRVPLNKHLSKPPSAEKPGMRYPRIERLFSELNLDGFGSRNAFMRAFNVTISDRPLEIQAIRRQMPEIVLRDHSIKPDRKTGWEVSGHYAAPAIVDLVHFAYTCDDRTAKECCVALRRTVEERGIIVSQWECDERIGSDYHSLDEMLKKIKTRISNGEIGRKVLVIFIDGKDSKSHGDLKLLERRHSILTQQLTLKLASEITGKYASRSNVVHKINCKLAGLNHRVLPDIYARDIWISNSRTMVMGYDVAHPPPETRTKSLHNEPPSFPSVVGFSFNGGAQPEAFIGDFHFQEPKREQVGREVLIARTKWMLRLFDKNQGLPDNIIVLRDGVSEGQYRMVIECELDSIREGCSEYANMKNIEDWSPKFLLVIVTKRHNLRFFSYCGGQVDNPDPCTVVDNVVTRNDMTEFYMQAHKAILGTAKSPSYQVLIDELNWTSDQLQSFLLSLCFEHQISDKAVSLPEPVFQADRWATRGRAIWGAFSEHFSVKRLPHKGIYSSEPIDFEKMTSLLAYWNSSLEENRVNA